MTEPFATLGGAPAVAARVHVPASGPWFADVDLESAPDLSGRVTLSLGALDLDGTIDDRFAGTFGLQRRVRIVAGAGGWGTLLPPKAYHNDAGVRAKTVAEDAAREAGEELGDFAPTFERIGSDYVRQSGPASRALEDVLGGAPWWVDYEGKTQVGTRPTVDAAAGSYQLLEQEPRERLVTLAVDDLRAVTIGSTLSDGLDAPQTVRELELVVSGADVRVRAWCGESVFGRLAAALRAIITRASDSKLFGLWRYRVVEMSGDRVKLQAVRRDAGLPNVLPVSMWPGVAGAHAQLAAGAEVLVEFIEGDRTQPIVTAFAGKDGNGFEPVKLSLGPTATLQDAARKHDTVRVTIPALSFLVAASGGGTLNPAPVDVDGEITSGSSAVEVG